jgi:hypothetical protein
MTRGILEEFAIADFRMWNIAVFVVSRSSAALAAPKHLRRRVSPL